VDEESTTLCLLFYHKKQSVNNVQSVITNRIVNGASMLVNLCFQKENGPDDPSVLKDNVYSNSPCAVDDHTALQVICHAVMI